MSRFNRPPFSFCDYEKLKLHPEAQNRLLFDWWCDDSDRRALIKHLGGKPLTVPSRSLRQDDPAPPVTEPAPQGLRHVVLLSNPVDVQRALTDHKTYSNIPYATLGGAAFLLAQDPPQNKNEFDWHQEQQSFINAVLGYCDLGLRTLAQLAVKQSEFVSLARPSFDLALFAEEAALRYMGQLYGFAFSDHALLQDASRATYRALQYIAVGQHFVSEPATLPAAQQALGKLAARISQLMQDYTELKRSPKKWRDPIDAAWPDGVQPWSELGLDKHLTQPLLQSAAAIPSQLSGRDRATVLATLLAGTLGNIQTAVCLLVQSLLAGDEGERDKIRLEKDEASLEAALVPHLGQLPPITVLPRRTLDQVMTSTGVDIEKDTDCLLLLEAQAGCPHVTPDRIWGQLPAATHGCLGRGVSMPLIAALVQRTLNLKGLRAALDPLTAETLDPVRLWGFACISYPLRFDRDRQKHNLIVAMRVKSPVSENAIHLRRLIAGSVPRVTEVLNGFGHVHHAWFEFTENDSQLVLRTIYSGQFEAYIRYFALRAGDLFDGLFEFLEDAPPRPVTEHPHEFIETIRRHNREPLAGYLYSRQP